MRTAYNHHIHVPIVLKSGSLNFLEPSGPVQACTGIAVPLHTKSTITKQTTALVTSPKELAY
jgi:hypothetical protein